MREMNVLKHYRPCLLNLLKKGYFARLFSLLMVHNSKFWSITDNCSSQLNSEEQLLATFLSYGPWTAIQAGKVGNFHPLFTRKGNLFLPTDVL